MQDACGVLQRRDGALEEDDLYEREGVVRTVEVELKIEGDERLAQLVRKNLADLSGFYRDIRDAFADPGGPLRQALKEALMEGDFLTITQGALTRDR